MDSLIRKFYGIQSITEWHRLHYYASMAPCMITYAIDPLNKDSVNPNSPLVELDRCIDYLETALTVAKRIKREQTVSLDDTVILEEVTC